MHSQREFFTLSGIVDRREYTQNHQVTDKLRTYIKRNMKKYGINFIEVKGYYKPKNKRIFKTDWEISFFLYPDKYYRTNPEISEKDYKKKMMGFWEFLQTMVKIFDQEGASFIRDDYQYYIKENMKSPRKRLLKIAPGILLMGKDGKGMYGKLIGKNDLTVQPVAAMLKAINKNAEENCFTCLTNSTTGVEECFGTNAISAMERVKLFLGASVEDELSEELNRLF